MTHEQKVQGILIQHGLDFQIDKVPFTAEYGGEKRDTPYFGLFNSKTRECIHSVKEGYTPSQNDAIVGAVIIATEKFGSKLTVNKAGSLGGGKQIYFQLGVEGLKPINGNDHIMQNVTIIDSNDGSTSLSVGIGDKTMSCDNQFYKFYADGQMRFRHSNSIKKKIEELPRLIELALARTMKQIVIYNKFASTELTKGLADKLVNSLLGHDRIHTAPEELAKLSTRSLANMNNLYNHIEKEIADKGETLWGLHSGVTSWTTHEKKGKNEDSTMRKMLTGANYAYNSKSFRFASMEAGILS